jgi:hypothetical protein
MAGGQARVNKAAERGAKTSQASQGLALMRMNIWIILAAMLALLAITRYAQQARDTQRICADDPTASVCHR